MRVSGSSDGPAGKIEMEPKRRVYLLSGREFPPEVIATAFAKTSRSSEPLDRIAQELSEGQSGRFHKKWVLEFGHSSIAEHAVLHIALEDISRLAAELLESCRLCSFTERSSRYQELTDYYLPPRIARSSPELKLYIEACERLFETYRSCLGRVRQLMEERYPRRPDEPERAYEARLRSRYSDICRFLLPTAALTTVGMTVNARSLAWLITKLLSHPLEEARELGQELKEAALKEAPTLLRYADENAYLARLNGEPLLEEAGVGSFRNEPGSVSGSESELELESESEPVPVQLVFCTPQAEERLTAALLYRYHPSGLSWEELFERAQKMSPKERERVLDSILGEMGEHDRPPRELEHIYYTFDVVLDQGAYRDLARHRMMTQTVAGPPTVELGYAIPKAIEEAGLREEYERAIAQASSAYRTIKQRFPHEAAYLVTNAHNRRVLMTLNLRELYHLVRLRARKEGHFSYRRIALKLYELVRKEHPRLVKHLRFADPQLPPSSEELEREYFSETAHLTQR